MRRARRCIAILLASCTLGVAACQRSEHAPAASYSVVDSAGVEIVKSLRPAWAEEPAWSIDPTPSLVIGSIDGDESYTLYQARFATVLPDGRIAISNSGTSQIRLYDRAGLHLVDIGRNGAGPGEFQGLSRVWGVAGDSILAYDYRLSRLTVFDGQGNLGRTLSLFPPGEARQVFAMRPFDSGDLLVEGVVPPRDGPPRPGLFDGGARLFARYSPEGELLNEIGEYESSPNWGFTIDGHRAYTKLPFSLSAPPSRGDGRWLYLGSGTEPQVERRRPDGRLDRIIRWDSDLPAVDATAQERFRDWRLGQSAEFRSSTEAMLDGIIFPDHIPAYRYLLMDSEGALWVERYTPEWVEGRRWWVFDRSGRWLGEPVLPPGLQLVEVGRDYILGTRRDELDVEQVVLHALDRHGGLP